MEHFTFTFSTEQSKCINPQLLDLLSASGYGVDDPNYNIRTDASTEPAEFEQPDALSLDVYHEADAYEAPVYEEDADHESLDGFPLAPSYSSLDREAPPPRPASQIEQDNTIRIDTDIGLEPLQPTESPHTPRIEVSAPNDFPSIESDRAARVAQKSRPQSRQASPRGRSSSITRPRAQSGGRKSSPIPRAMANRIITALENMPVNRQGPYTVGDRTAPLQDLHLHASFPPPMPIQPSTYSCMTAPAPDPFNHGYRCSHKGCPEHARVWDTRSERDHHERKHVPKDQRAHPCQHCGKKFLFPKDVGRHVDAVHLGLRVICPHCTKAYSRKDNLDRHIKAQHGYGRSSGSASQMSANSPTASTPLSHAQSPVDYTGRTTPLNLSPVAVTSAPWSKPNHHHRHDSVNEPSSHDCEITPEPPPYSQPMFKSYSNGI